MDVNASDVADWGNFTKPSGAELEALERVIAAVTYTIDRTFATHTPHNDAEKQAVIMQSFRLWNRKGDASGIREFAEITARSVVGIDGDVAELLTPSWGVA